MPGILTLLGLVAGGWLNVLIDRLPIYLNQVWTVEAFEQLEEFEKAAHERAGQAKGKAFWLAQCPQCGGVVSKLLSVPALRCFVHQGRCSSCGYRAHARCPLVECITALGWGASGYAFGASWELLAVLLLLSSLVALACIDLEHCILPDQIVFPLLFLGLLVNTQAVFAASLESAVWGTVAGYVIFWAVRQAYLLVRGVEGLGLGDCKLLGTIGAWVGWEHLALTIAVASVAYLLTLWCTRRGASDRLAFGPGLAAGAVVALCF